MPIEGIDRVYQEVQSLLKEHGDPLTASIKQSILLKEDRFVGYCFQGDLLRVDWLVEKHVFNLLDHQGAWITAIPIVDTIKLEHDEDS